MSEILSQETVVPLKGVFNKKWFSHHFCHSKTCMTFFLLWNMLSLNGQKKQSKQKNIYFSKWQRSGNTWR